MKALLSIKPEFAEKIFSGAKRFEYRKIPFRKNVTNVVVYSSSPVQRIIGEFTVKRIIEGSPEEVWRRTQSYSGISKDFFTSYFSGKQTAYAIEINEFIRYKDEIDPFKENEGFVPPQSYRYMPSETVRRDVQFSLF